MRLSQVYTSIGGRAYIYPVTSVDEIQRLADILGVNVGGLPTVYLGMPLGSKEQIKGDMEQSNRETWEEADKLENAVLSPNSKGPFGLETHSAGIIIQC